MPNICGRSLLICTEPANQRSNRLDWQALAVQARAMQVEARNAAACRHRNGLLRRFEELIRPAASIDRRRLNRVRAQTQPTLSAVRTSASMCAKTAAVVVWLATKSGGRPMESRLARK